MQTTTLIKVLALAAAFGSSAAAASAQTTESLPGARSQAAAQSVNVTNTQPDTATEQQELHVMMPALSGDGGG
jgi:hypothetical protein